jgi:hypothetical protein
VAPPACQQQNAGGGEVKRHFDAERPGEGNELEILPDITGVKTWQHTQQPAQQQAWRQR